MADTNSNRMLPNSDAFTDCLQGWARDAGFDGVGITTRPLTQDAFWLSHWLAQGFHGEMDWMTRHLEKRVTPAALAPGTISVISARMNCRPEAADAEAVLANGRLAYVARYALGRDYHKLLRSRLRRLATRIAQELHPHNYRVLADSAPALEKAHGRNAGLGWIGKNTLLLNRHSGSWFLLGEIYTDLPLANSASTSPAEHCGSCTACIDICPTHALVGSRQLDARRCISYLTIEHDGSIPLEFRSLIGNRIFGCDDCQLCCPWNRYAQAASETDFMPRHDLDRAMLIDLFGWDEATWRSQTEGMALRRTGYRNWLRNLAVALGNSPPSAEVEAALSGRADYPDAVVREHITWAQARQAHLRYAEIHGTEGESDA